MQDDEIVLPTIDSKWIWDGPAFSKPQAAHGQLLFLDGTPSSSLAWATKLQECNSNTLIHLDLGLFSEKLVHIDDLIQRAAWNLSMGELKRRSIELKLTPLGLLLGRIAPASFEPLHVRLPLLQELVDILPDSIPYYIELDLQYVQGTAEELLFYDAARFEIITPIIKNGSYQSRYPNSTISQQPPPAYHPATTAITLCNHSLEMLKEYQHEQPIALATLEAFSNNWEDIEHLIVPSHLTYQEKRIVQGFLATGGNVTYLPDSLPNIIQN